MKIKIDIEKLKRFSKGLSNGEEEKYIRSLFIEHEANSEFRQLIKHDFDEYLKTHPDENHNLSYLLDRIHHIIHKKDSHKKEKVVKRIYRWYSAVAAILIIPILIAGGLWFINHPKPQEAIFADAPVVNTLFAPLGSRIRFSLPDGTRGWLNSGSSLEYSIPFTSNRHVAIVGEAWFDVAHDANHPFEISAGDSKVKVLGTMFNLNAYPEEKYIEVVLEEGKVEFSTSGQSSPVEMEVNERLVYSDDSIRIANTDVAKYTAWKEGKLVFRGDPMAEVARRIARWYNVDVELVDKDLEKYVIRGIFQDDSLEDVFMYLSMTSPLRYKIQERKLLADGTWQKKKVLLYKK